MELGADVPRGFRPWPLDRDGSALARAARALPRVLPWAILIAFAAGVGWIAFAGHTVGDYSAESDFYGGYAEGARLVQRGVLDPQRYIVVGPIYESALALWGRLSGDLFLGAELISLVSAIATLGLWFAMVRRLAGAAAGAWTLAVLATNPSFARYAYTASTDMLALFLQSASLFAMLAARGALAPWVAGALAGLATLTRYSGIYLLAGTWFVSGMPSATRPAGRAAGAFLAGFLLVVGPWLAYSLASGVVPGEQLVRGYSFYSNSGGSRFSQESVRRLAEAPRPHAALGEVVTADPGAFLAGLLRAVPGHLEGDARELLGWPVAAVLLIGGLSLARSTAAKRLLPISILGVCAFATLLPAFHSHRYSLTLAPFYATAGAGLALWPLGAGGLRVGPFLGRVVGVAAIAVALISNVRLQREALRRQPREVIEAGRSLAAMASPGDRVMSRKGHIGYYSGLDVVPFPRFRTLRELAAHARAQGADFLYYSWYETQLRPEFRYLLDTTATVPGLSIVSVPAAGPAVVYRIGPDFGRPPEWIADDFARSIHEARAMVRVGGASVAPEHHRVLALAALLDRRWEEALEHATAAAAAAPDDALAHTFRGEALRHLDRNDDARAAFSRAIALDPSEPAAAIGLGRVERADGNWDRAARWWRTAAGVTGDTELLAEISRLLAGVADSSGARDVRGAIDRIANEREARRAGPRPAYGSLGARSPFLPLPPSSAGRRRRAML